MTYLSFIYVPSIFNSKFMQLYLQPSTYPSTLPPGHKGRLTDEGRGAVPGPGPAVYILNY